ncbi:hypothetical protein F4780DRAFT_777426 [Xylariomycetidae sp. FL0641]|nr:hypothetical protein F4780DRAFT_777426 [Xylariomycetidae sp. FL0641]
MPPIPARNDALHRPSSPLSSLRTTARHLSDKLASRTPPPLPLLARASTDASTVPEGYGKHHGALSPGAIAGIVLGSVAGFLLLLYLVYMAANLGGGRRRGPPPPAAAAAHVETGSVRSATMTSLSVVSRHAKPRPHRHSKRSSRRRSSNGSRHRRETVEIRKSSARPVSASSRPGPPPPPPPEIIDEIVVEEHGGAGPRPRRRSRSRSPPRPRIVEDSSTESDVDDEIVVEEHTTPPRRRDSRPGSYGRRPPSVGVYDDHYRYDRSASRRRSGPRR